MSPLFFFFLVMELPLAERQAWSLIFLSELHLGQGGGSVFSRAITRDSEHMCNIIGAWLLGPGGPEVRLEGRPPEWSTLDRITELPQTSYGRGGQEGRGGHMYLVTFLDSFSQPNP